MKDAEEQAYERGRAQGLSSLLRHVASELGYELTEAKHAALIVEREATVAALRRICAEHGDSAWPDALYLPDVIEKHLERYLGDGVEVAIVAECRAIAEQRARDYAARKHGDVVNGYAADRLCAIFRSLIAGACERCRGTGEAFTEGAERPFAKCETCGGNGRAKEPSPGS